MRSALRWPFLVVLAGLFASTGSLFAQTPDGITPAVEEACDKYKDEGARYGLCVAYCEAQDCEGTKLDPNSCFRIQQKFIEYSIKKGYEPGKKPQPISCRVAGCSSDDVLWCRGKEVDCINRDTRDCESVCTAHFLGFVAEGKPICVQEPDCKRCVGDTPKP